MVLTVADSTLLDLRSRMGASAALWAGTDGVRVEPARWVAMSGARTVSYNLILCHGACDGKLLAESVDDIGAAKVPGIVMVAGAALGEVQQLVLRGWVCIGAMPFMMRDLVDGAAPGVDSGVRCLEGTELAVARRLISDVFDLHERFRLVALPDDAADRPGQGVWGAFDDRGELVACVAAVRAGEFVGIWSLATARDARRRGHAARLMNTVLADASSRGARGSLLYAPVEAEPFYRSLGYRELERWQLWSNPRWVFGRA